MNPELRKAMAFFAAVLALGIPLAMFAPSLLGFAAGPEAEVIGQLKRTESSGFKLEIPAASTPLVSQEHFFARIVVEAELEARRAIATATLDFEGALGETKVSSLGYEKVVFHFEDGEWVAPSGMAPRLAGIVSALERRRRALAAEQWDWAQLEPLVAEGEAPVERDAALRSLSQLQQRQYRAEAWFIRSEREEVTVSEAYRIVGETPDRPVDERGTRRLVLKETGGEFLFVAGLM